MIEFKNRKSTNINRRKLTVVDDPLYDNGKLKQLTVDVERANSGITVEGTKLNASSLNNVFKMINDSIAFLLNGYFTVGNLEVSWVQEKYTPKKTKFTITTKQKFYVKVSVDNPLISVGSVNETTNYIDFEIKETTNLNEKLGSSTMIYYFTVDLFIDSYRTQCIKSLTGKVNYTFTSTNPIE